MDYYFILFDDEEEPAFRSHKLQIDSVFETFNRTVVGCFFYIFCSRV